MLRKNVVEISLVLEYYEKGSITMEVVKQNFNEKVCGKKKLMEIFWKTKDYEERANIAVEIYRANPVCRKEYDEAPAGAKEYWKWLYYDHIIREVEGDEADFIVDNIERVCETNTDDDWDYIVGHQDNI